MAKSAKKTLEDVCWPAQAQLHHGMASPKKASAGHIHYASMNNHFGGAHGHQGWAFVVGLRTLQCSYKANMEDLNNENEIRWSTLLP